MLTGNVCGDGAAGASGRARVYNVLITSRTEAGFSAKSTAFEAFYKSLPHAVTNAVHWADEWDSTITYTIHAAFTCRDRTGEWLIRRLSKTIPGVKFVAGGSNAGQSVRSEFTREVMKITLSQVLYKMWRTQQLDKTICGALQIHDGHNPFGIRINIHGEMTVSYNRLWPVSDPQGAKQRLLGDWDGHNTNGIPSMTMDINSPPKDTMETTPSPSLLERILSLIAPCK